MPNTAPPLKPEHKLMQKTDAGGPFGFGARSDHQSFRLVPTSPLSNNRMLLLMISMVIGPFPVLVPAIHAFTRSPTERMIGYIIMGVSGLFIASLLYLSALIRAKATGTLMIFDKTSGSVSLPNENKTFRREQIDHLQVLRVQGKGNRALMIATELNLIAKFGEARARAAIAGEIDEYILIEDAIGKLIEETDLPVFLYTVFQNYGVPMVEIKDMRKRDQK